MGNPLSINPTEFSVVLKRVGFAINLNLEDDYKSLIVDSVVGLLIYETFGRETLLQEDIFHISHSLNHVGVEVVVVSLEEGESVQVSFQV